MVIDPHNHTAVSADSMIDPDMLVEVAKGKGIDGIGITEHSRQKSEAAEELAKRHDFLVIGGMELGTELGDVLIFGIDRVPRYLHSAADISAYVMANGGVLIAAHPLRYDLSPKPWLKPVNALTLESACKRHIFKLVDAMEVVNGFATEEDVKFGAKLSAILGLGAVGGSDAHAVQEIGFCVTIFEDEIRSEADFITAIKCGRYRPEDRRLPEQKSPIHPFVRRVDKEKWNPGAQLVFNPAKDSIIF